MQSIKPSHTFSINPTTVYTIIDQETVLLGQNDDSLYTINPVGTELLQQLADEPKSMETLLNYLLEQFNVEKEQCLEDIQVFLNELLEKKLIIKID